MYPMQRPKGRAALLSFGNPIDAVTLTHAHIDHSNYSPLVAREGFNGLMYYTHAI
jgi:Cft2 family RNA processing exonuclease